MAISRTSIHFMSFFLGHVDAVFRNLDHQILVRHHRLAGQARCRLQPPRLVEQIIFGLFRRLQGIEAFAQDDMAGGAGAGFFAGMFDFHIVLQQRIANRNPRFDLEQRTLGTKLLMRQHDDFRHYFASSSEIFLPASTLATLLSMRACAKLTVASFSAVMARLMARWSASCSVLRNAAI